MKKTAVIISGLQMRVTNRVPENERRIRKALLRAAGDRADFLLTPEGSLSGYHAAFNSREVAAAVRRLAALAKKMRVGLALGTCFKDTWNGKTRCYNQVRLYSPEGRYLGAHNKILRTTSLERPGTGEMRDYVRGRLRTFVWQGVRFGVLICNDMWASPHVTTLPNPHLAWRLKRMGARFVLHAVHSGIDPRIRPFHESTVEIRARSLKMPIVEVNAAKDRGRAVNARSGPVNADGKRPFTVPARGEHYFVCKIRV
jgi:predicted amidohydrolase